MRAVRRSRGRARRYIRTRANSDGVTVRNSLLGSLDPPYTGSTSPWRPSTPEESRDSVLFPLDSCSFFFYSVFFFFAGRSSIARAYPRICARFFFERLTCCERTILRTKTSCGRGEVHARTRLFCVLRTRDASNVTAFLSFTSVACFFFGSRLRSINGGIFFFFFTNLSFTLFYEFNKMDFFSF